MIRKATQNDILPVAKLYEMALDYEETHKKYTSWQRGIYPTADTAKAGVKRETLYVLENETGELCGAVILDSNQPPEYREIAWSEKLRHNEVLVIHTLCVSTKHTGEGVGSALLDFAKELAKEKGCNSIRLNTTSKNTPALRFYEKNGFTVAAEKEILLNGQIKCQSHLFLNYKIK